MERRRAIVLVIALALAALTVVAARALDEPPLHDEIAAARGFEGFPLYWVGEQFEDWDLKAVELPRFGFATLVYGDCEVEDPDGIFGPEGGSCTPPLQIQIAPLCFHLDVVARAPIWKRRSVRGAPVGSSDSAPVLFTRGAQVKVYRGQGSDAGLAMRALRALRSLNAVPPVIAATGPIPAPDRRILDGSLPCSDSRPGTVVIDENRGTYRGVGIGSTAAEVRRALGPKVLVAAQVSKPACRWSSGAVRYPEASFTFCEGRVVALTVTEQGARTLAGLAIGDRLAAARSLYPALRCGVQGERPFCTGRMRPKRSLWFAGDPIRSLTISTAAFPGGR